MNHPPYTPEESAKGALTVEECKEVLKICGYRVRATHKGKPVVVRDCDIETCRVWAVPNGKGRGFWRPLSEIKFY